MECGARPHRKRDRPSAEGCDMKHRLAGRIAESKIVVAVHQRTGSLVSGHLEGADDERRVLRPADLERSHQPITRTDWRSLSAPPWWRKLDQSTPLEPSKHVSTRLDGRRACSSPPSEQLAPAPRDLLAPMIGCMPDDPADLRDRVRSKRRAAIRHPLGVRVRPVLSDPDDGTKPKPYRKRSGETTR